MITPCFIKYATQNEILVQTVLTVGLFWTTTVLNYTVVRTKDCFELTHIGFNSMTNRFLCPISFASKM